MRISHQDYEVNYVFVVVKGLVCERIAVEHRYYIS